MRRLCLAPLLVAVVLGLPEGAAAQVDELDQTFAELDKKLPAGVWDGKTLNVSTYDELLEVKAYAVEYKRLTEAATEIWNRLSKEDSTEERRNKLNAYIDEMNLLIEAYNKKSEEIKPPWHFPFTGPDVGKGKPYVVDTVGDLWTNLWVRNIPSYKGSKQQPWRYMIYAKFLVYYKDMAPEDVVLIQPMKGSKKLGPPKVCSMNFFSDIPLAGVDCQTHSNDPAYSDLYSVGGDIEVQLIYRRVLEGTEIKNFETLHMRLVSLPQPGTTPPQWGPDYDGELGRSTIQQYTEGGVLRGWSGPVYEAWNTSVSHEPGPRVMIRTMFKSNGSLGSMTATCLHDGKRIWNGEVQNRWDASNKAIKGNNWDTASWHLGVIYMNGVLSRPMQGYSDDVYVLSEHPGDYKCVITGGGAALKELYFTVDEKGFIVKPPCQERSITAPRSITVIRATLKKPYPIKWDKTLATKRAYGGGATWAKGCPPAK